MTRVLHVVGAMDRGGVETWLLHVLRNTPPNRVRHDILVHHDGDYDAEVEAAGARLIPFGTPRNRPLRYIAGLTSLMQREGPYDIVHSHIYDLSGAVLLAARLAGVPSRLAHAHRCEVPAQSRLRSAFANVGRAAIRRFATGGLANSTLAAQSLFGPDWDSDSRFRVLLYGFDFDRFANAPARDEARRQLDLPEDALIIGHVGRFVVEKNHELMIDIVAELDRRSQNVHLVMVGDGSRREMVARRASEKGIDDRCHFLGARGDVHRVMAAFDLFLLPSHSEGFGIVAVEAQAAALPVVTSETVPREIEVVPELIRRVELSAPVECWADAILTSAAADAPSDAYARVSGSQLGIDHCVDQLLSIYHADQRTHD